MIISAALLHPTKKDPRCPKAIRQRIRCLRINFGVYRYFLLIIFAIFHLTFSENLFYLSTVIPDGAFKDVNTFSSLFVDTEYEEDEEGNISGANSIKSPGVFLQGLVEELGELVNGAREVEEIVDENGTLTEEVVEEGGWIPRLLKRCSGLG